jgi:hypothetical protein
MHSLPMMPCMGRRVDRGTVLALVLALAAWLGLPAHPLGAQPAARVSGRAILRGTQSGLAGVSVTVEGTDVATLTDSAGRWSLLRVPAGPQQLVARRLGYAPTRLPITVPLSGTLVVDLEMATSALRLGQLTVTATQSGRARGELGTASVIDRDAIANQIASSLQGVLELVPGVPLQPPGLDAAAQFSLRTLPQGGGSAGFSGASADDIGAAGTLIVLDGVPLSNNANLQTVGARGQIVSPASTAGGGIDLRRIPAATLERVEVIRGIPSVRWGDLTQGAIIVETRAAAVAPELAARLDPRTREANLVGGRSFDNARQAVTATFNLADTRSVQSLASAATRRGAGQLAHRLALGVAPGDGKDADGRMPRPRVTFDTRLDWWQLGYNAPEREDLEPGRNSFTNDRGLRLGERARLALGKGTLEWTAALDAQAQYTRETRLLSRPALPFTDQMSEGRAIGRYLDGLYLGAYELKGAPRLLYTRMEWESATAQRGRRAGWPQTRAGMELRREWNGGEGYLFDMARPPQTSSFNGTRGFDRPRRFGDVPPLVTSAAYADVRATANRLGMLAEVQSGVRVDLLHGGGWWTSGVRAVSVQPRLTAQLAPRPWVRLRGGAGVVSKLPTVAQLFPAPQFFDVVNVNRYTINPAERLAVLTTFIRDPTNSDLRFSRALKRELGIDLDGGAGRGALSVAWFDDRLLEAVTLRRDAGSLLRDRYRLVDTAQGSGQPGRIVDPPFASVPVPIFLDRYVNGGTLGGRGIEYTVRLPVVPRLRTRLEVSGATLRSTFRTSDRDYGNVARLETFQTDTTVQRVAFFDGASYRSSRSIVTWRVVHHQPDLGLVITGVIQQRLGDERVITGRTDSLSFSGYLTRAGEVVLVPEADRTQPQYADLRLARPATARSTTRQPDDWLLSLQIAKAIGANGRLSFYVFNALDKLASFSAGGTVRALPSSRFGVELTLPTSMLFGGPR